MPRKSTGSYPPDWKDIARRVKDEAGRKCVRCRVPDGYGGVEPPAGKGLTIHHLDMNPSNNRWWNLAALCQRCHLQIQHKVIMERPFLFEHSAWFKPYVAGYYAFHNKQDDSREAVMARVEELIALGSQ